MDSIWTGLLILALPILLVAAIWVRWELRDLRGTLESHLELHDRHERTYADEAREAHD